MAGDERQRPRSGGVPPAVITSGRGVPPPGYSAEALFAGASEIWIRHEQDIYRLRMTRNGKLILTK